MNSSPPLARREIIANRLEQGAPVNAVDLAGEFDVSEDAIRRDLRALAAQGRCRRVYGGALPLSPASTPISVRLEQNSDRKRNLARTALSLIQPDEWLFLDSGSTNLALARMLPVDMGISVATNSISIAAAVLERKGIPLTMIGGAVDREVGGCVATGAVLALHNINIDRAFMGVCALSREDGICAFDDQDAAFKRALVEVSQHIVVMATHEKLNTRARHRVTPLQRLSALVVEAEAANIAADLTSGLPLDLMVAPFT